ncbi:STAS domain-containing protein [Candidatus Peregrinibacteria bacterium]|nr:STAS domain-containing protein [Candidatus Peregrinibacteria bacterium]
MAQVNITISDLTLAGGKAAKQIAFSGQLDETNVDEEAKKIYAVIEHFSDAPAILLDFGGLEYMNSKSIGYVTDWYSKVAEKGGKLVIAQPKSNIVDILKVVGITQIVPVADSIDAGKKKLEE